ncbi:nicotinamide mononucleotide transporter family protein [Mycoplasma sp. 246B]
MFVAFSGILGVFSIILFAKRKKIAYILAITNAILYLFFSFTNGLVIDGFIQILYIFILFYIYIKQILIHKNNKRIRELRLSSYAAILFFIIFVVISTSFYFLNPYTNDFISKLLRINYIEFSSNFKYKTSASAILAIFNAISIIALIMMAFGFRSNWIIWCFKNIICFVFFSGIGFLSWTLIFINFIYLSISIYLYLITSKESRLSIAFVGMGASGKSSIINNLRKFLNQNNIQIIDERLKDEKIFIDYMNDMKKNGYRTQKIFFKDRYIQIKQMQNFNKSLIDRHMIDDFLFPKCLIKINYFTKWQKFAWNYFYHPWYKFLLSLEPKIDLVFVVLKDIDFIWKNRLYASKNHQLQTERYRRTIELKNKEFFKVVNIEYLNNRQLGKLLSKNLKIYSKEHHTFINIEKDIASSKIKQIIKSKLKESFKL